ncbi:GtrA family protein [Stenotrophomonas sp. 169]|uniref:GtrA family protein n=1 Tax=Stenotrophomonas sp. 169 TaxID=2770322 RepID=UPI0016624D10|nr:GtrA family protein [Stenotrophomonas sp. 169]QNR97811.1 GtrA family protein [Stenotrophomonas sp. 169]
MLDRSLTLKFLRFCVVGGLSTLAFSLLTWLAVSELHMEPTWATVLCYLVLVPPNFLAHRNFTFVSRGHISREGRRFVALHAFNLLLSTLGMKLITDVFHKDYRWGIVFSAVVVPVVVFVLMNRWVFPRRPDSQTTPPSL